MSARSSSYSLVEAIFNFLFVQIAEKKYILSILFFVGLLSGLKIPFMGFLPIITLGFCYFFLAAGRIPEAISLSLLSLYLIVSFDESAITPGFIRYIIYATSFAFFLSYFTKEINSKRFFIFLAFALTLFFTSFKSTFIQTTDFVLEVILRDLFVLIVLFIFCFKGKDLYLNFPFILYLLLGTLFGEFINIVLFDASTYFNLSSTKSLILIPAIYYLSQKRYALGLIISLISLIIISNYGTRMILFALIIFSIIAGFIWLVKKNQSRLYLIAFFTLLGFVLFLRMIFQIEFFLGFKAFSFLSTFVNFDELTLLEVLKLLDPVRYAEHQLFFSRSWFDIIFGSGIGIGIHDLNGYLGFVNYWQAAFTQEEIRTNFFFNLHDYWIDFGLRFGLLPTLIILYLVSIRPMLKGHYAYGILVGVLAAKDVKTL